MRFLSLLIIASLLTGCGAQSQRMFGYGPYQYCRDGDVCFQAGEKWEFYPFSPGSAHEYAQKGRECWAESNRANWDLCTERF